MFQFEEQLQKNPNQSISDFFNAFLKDQNIERTRFYHTKNQGTVVLLLYGLLVVPREIWEKSETNFKFESRKYFNKILPSSSDIDTLDFLRLLRNSIAHANFSLDTNTATWCFWNLNKKGKKFEVSIATGHLGEFLAEVGKYYVNEVRNKKKASANN